MSEEILINVTPQETRVAVVENGMLQEMLIERTRKRGLVGNIYLGRVSRVLPGMQAAFIDIGVVRTAFIHISDLTVNQNRDENAALSIEQVLREGDKLLVQVTKDPLGSKGARLTTHLSLPSRYLVMMPNNSNIGISQRIECVTERERLQTILDQHVPATIESEDPESEISRPHGFIIRTAAESVTENDIVNDIQYLNRLWGAIQNRVADSPALSMVYEDLPLVLRTLRDLVGPAIEKIRIDSNETYARALDFARKFMPELEGRIEHYPGGRPILDLYSVEDEIQKALQRKIELKSGGHIVIDQTEAMTTIDVNTGGFVGHRNLEETIFKTNLEAAQALARQLRLRNLGGIIIVDFIDMLDVEHQRHVTRALEKALEKDHAKTTLGEIGSLGLLQLTRKRTRESLEHILCEQCPTCSGRASIKTAETVCYEILREIIREARQFETEQLLVVASQEVVDIMLDDESSSIAELEAFIGRPIKYQVESTYSQEQYDVVLL